MLVILRTSVFVIVMVIITVPMLITILWLFLTPTILGGGAVRIHLRRPTDRFQLDDLF